MCTPNKAKVIYNWIFLNPRKWSGYLRLPLDMQSNLNEGKDPIFYLYRFFLPNMYADGGHVDPHPAADWDLRTAAHWSNRKTKFLRQFNRILSRSAPVLVLIDSPWRKISVIFRYNYVDADVALCFVSSSTSVRASSSTTSTSDTLATFESGSSALCSIKPNLLQLLTTAGGGQQSFIVEIISNKWNILFQIMSY